MFPGGDWGLEHLTAEAGPLLLSEEAEIEAGSNLVSLVVQRIF